jgi:hypothetical protein
LWPEVVYLRQIDAAAESILKKEPGIFHAYQGEGAAGLDLYGKIDVTLGAILAPGNGAEYRKVAHSAPAELRLFRYEPLAYSLESVSGHGVRSWFPLCGE